MGCDIHIVIERKYKGKWVGLHSFPYHTAQVWVNEQYVDKLADWQVRRRDYALFGDLADVRVEGELGNKPRGVPEDASDLARMEIDHWDVDGHSHSHMLLSEALPIFIKHKCATEAVAQRFEGRTQQDIYEWFVDGHIGINFDSSKETLDDYRLVFWFDN